jgi:hypothetical protein
MPDTDISAISDAETRAVNFTIDQAAIAQARTAQPTALPIEVSRRIDIAAVAEVPLATLSGISGLSGPQQAGLHLSQIVLCLIAGSIGLLFVYLVVMEFVTSGPYDDITAGVVEQAKSAGDMSASLDKRRNAVVDLLRANRDRANPNISHASAILLNEFVRDVRASGRLSAENLKALDACVAQFRPGASGGTTPVLVDRQAATDACLQVLDSAELAAVGPGLDIERLRLLRDLGKDALDARQAIRSFWLQAAQLVLLNLLLPALTALLGYIFGTQQQQRISSG